MSIITCPSCGMQYDGSGMQPGVKFQCTECSAMVTVGGAPKPRPVGKKPAGQPSAAGGPPGRVPARNLPGQAPGRAMPGGPGGGGYPQGPGFAPQKSSNTGLFVGLGVGAAALIVIIIAVVAASGPSPEEQRAAEKKQRDAELQKQNEERDQKTAERNAAMVATYNACLDMGRSIETAMRNEDAAGLSAMFDWNKYASYNRSVMGADREAYATDKAAVLYGEGEWKQNDEGIYTGTYSWSTIRPADSLRENVMDYIKEFLFGAPEVYWNEDKSKHDNSRFGLEIDGTNYIGHYIFIRVDGSSKEFWVAGETGSTNVKILNFVDKSAFSNMQKLIEAKNPRPVDDIGQRDPYNPDRDPRNPDREDGDTSYDPDVGLPDVSKTGRMPTEPALVNAVNEVERGLNERRLQNVRQESSVEEKHATMGAFIDKLIDAQQRNDRRAKLEISSALYKIWGSMLSAIWTRDELVYTLDGMEAGGQSTSDLPIRRWLSHYDEYLEIMDQE